MKKKLMILFLFTTLQSQVGFNVTGRINEGGGGNVSRYNGVAVDSNDRIIAVGFGNGTSGVIRCYSRVNGEDDPVIIINEENGGANPRNYYGVAVDSTDRIVAVGVDNDNNGVIRVYNADGTPTDISINEAGGNDDPTVYYGVAVDSTDRIVAVGSDKGLDGVIRVYNADGTPTDIRINEVDGGDNPSVYYGVTVDSNDRIIAVGKDNNDNGVIRVYNANGTPTDISINEDPENQDGDHPSIYYGVAVDSNNRIIAVGVDNENDGVIRVYNANGTLALSINEVGGDDDPRGYNGVAVDLGNRIIVVSDNNNTNGVIRVYNASGSLAFTINEDSDAEDGDHPRAYYGVAVDSSRAIIAVGLDAIFAGNGVIARYLPDDVLGITTNSNFKIYRESWANQGISTGLI